MHRTSSPPVNYRFGVDFRDALENAAPEFLPGLNPDVLQEGARHLPKERLDNIQPRAVRGGQNVFESVGAGGQERLGFLREVRRVVVQNQANHTVRGVVVIQVLEQGDELPNAVTLLHPRRHVTIMQIQARQNGTRTQAFVFVIAGHGGVLPRHRGPVRRRVSNRLQSRCRTALKT